MDVAAVIDLGREALWMTVLISAPLLGVALAAGLLIGVIQAATSINEMTLSFIPKCAALAVVMVLTGGWQICIMIDFTRRIFERIPQLFN
ncbi:MAG: flagellar biosynthesis protein FliQ [Betaproteobacteria bacterium]